MHQALVRTALEMAVHADSRKKKCCCTWILAANTARTTIKSSFGEVQL